jgi:hypothetical protein
MAYAIAERSGIGAELIVFTMAKRLEGGAMAGLIGGLFAAIWSMAYAAFTGYGLWFPFDLAGAAFQGPQALVGGAGVMVWGLSVLLGTSILLGIVYSFMVNPQVQNLSSLLGGVIFGMAVLAIRTYLVLPWANPVLSERVWMMPSSWFLTHIVFGLGVASVPMLERFLGGRASRRSPPALL